MKTKEVDLSKLAKELDDLRKRLAKIISDKDWTTIHDATEVIKNLSKI